MISISFVIPLFNEEDRVEKLFEALTSVRIPRGLKLEKVIFVDDGSTDTTFKQLTSFSNTKHGFDTKVINYKTNRGKGNAIKLGMLASSSNYTLFFDADISTPLSELEKFVPQMKKGTDVLVGTRKNGKSTVIVHQPRYREILGRGFTLITQKVLNLDVTDFTCGFKAFSRLATEEIFNAAQIQGWGYDAEIIFLAKRNQLSIHEVPVIWANDARTKVVLYKAIPQTIADIFQIYWVHNIQNKYQFNKKQNEKQDMRKNPLISVVMPVYNAQDYLRSAMDSILNQTYQNFEFIVVDDASTDNSWAILKSYAKRNPNKITILRNDQNMKQGKTASRAISIAKGDYIARMDADDVSSPNRLEKQLAYLKTHPETVAVGAQCILIDKNSEVIGEKTFPTDFEDIYKYSFRFSPAQQPTFMIAMRRLPKDFQFYDHGMSPVEDIELMFKLFKYGKVENMPDYLLKYRIHAENSSLKNVRKSYILIFISRIRSIFYHGYRPTILGLVTTFAQLFIVIALPERLTFFLYKKIKKFKNSTPLLTTAPNKIWLNSFRNVAKAMVRLSSFL